MRRTGGERVSGEGGEWGGEEGEGEEGWGQEGQEEEEGQVGEEEEGGRLEALGEEEEGGRMQALLRKIQGELEGGGGQREEGGERWETDVAGLAREEGGAGAHAVMKQIGRGGIHQRVAKRGGGLSREVYGGWKRGGGAVCTGGRQSEVTSAAGMGCDAGGGGAGWGMFGRGGGEEKEASPKWGTVILIRLPAPEHEEALSPGSALPRRDASTSPDHRASRASLSPRGTRCAGGRGGVRVWEWGRQGEGGASGPLPHLRITRTSPPREASRSPTDNMAPRPPPRTAAAARTHHHHHHHPGTAPGITVLGEASAVPHTPPQPHSLPGGCASSAGPPPLIIKLPLPPRIALAHPKKPQAPHVLLPASPSRWGAPPVGSGTRSAAQARPLEATVCLYQPASDRVTLVRLGRSKGAEVLWDRPWRHCVVGVR